MFTHWAGFAFGFGITWLRHMSLRRNFVVWRLL